MDEIVNRQQWKPTSNVQMFGVWNGQKTENSNTWDLKPEPTEYGSEIPPSVLTTPATSNNNKQGKDTERNVQEEEIRFLNDRLN